MIDNILANATLQLLVALTVKGDLHDGNKSPKAHDFLLLFLSVYRCVGYLQM